jgi:hypothetical protein
MSHFNPLMSKLLLTLIVKVQKQLLDSRDLGKTDIKYSTVLFWFELDIELGTVESGVEFKFKLSPFIYKTWYCTW